MEKQFFNARPPSDNGLDRVWQEATLVFDTNVLLDLYTLKPSTRQSFLAAFERLQDRLFLPHQVVVEVARNRESKIHEAQSPFDKARNYLQDWKDNAAHHQKLEGQLEDLKGVREDALPFDYLTGELEEVVEDAAASIREKIDRAEEEHPVAGEDIPAPGDDPILKQLFNVFEGRMGEEYGQERYEQILDEADLRGKRKTPPGYADLDDEDKLGDHQYGDQILWNQILDYAEKHTPDILFVTGDASKGDWFDGKGSDAEPRDELWREFRRRTGQTFWMVKPVKFLAEVKERFGLDVSEESLREAEEISDGSAESQGANVTMLEEQFNPLFEQGVVDPECLDLAREQLLQAWSSQEMRKASALANLLYRVYSKYEDLTGMDIFEKLSENAIDAASRLNAIPNSQKARDTLYYLESDIQRARKVLSEKTARYQDS